MELIADSDIDLVLNLTTPQAHYEYNLAALKAGKHVYTEKPLAMTFAEGKELVELAKEKGLLIGCAPDTFLGGRLQNIRELIDSGKYSHDQVEEMIHFLQEELCVKNPETKLLEDAELILYIKSKLNRPLRVCGMVKNVGEPGGGPFLAYNSDGTISLQILESSQIDMNDPVKKAMFEKGTHFNPVDLVCGVRDSKGCKFDLRRYTDPATGFISSKSSGGRDLRAQELPGLWNGAMAKWNTVFVDVPVTTFSPVKVVQDLLRPQHQ